jgi:hypothetical protein
MTVAALAVALVGAAAAPARAEAQPAGHQVPAVHAGHQAPIARTPAGWTPPPRPTGITPNFCQAASVQVILEGSFGHTYRCSGYYSVNETTYYLTTNAWSGWVDRGPDSFGFCDWSSGPIGWEYTYGIYLSPTKEPWC